MLITAGEGTALPKFYCLSYGDTGSGKTHFYATWPKPYFIFSLVEKGYQTLMGLNKKYWFNPEIPPRGFAVSSSEEMLDHLRNVVKPLVAKGDIETVVFDGGSFYFDHFYGKINAAASAAKGAKNVYGLWDTFRNHVRLVQSEINSLPCNAAWGFHSRESGGEGETKEGEIFAYGAAKVIIPAGCPNHFFHKRRTIPGKGDSFEVHTKPCGIYPAKVRITNPNITQEQLPNPLPESTYRCLVKSLGYTL